jgi:hypothetical protein
LVSPPRPFLRNVCASAVNALAWAAKQKSFGKPPHLERRQPTVYFLFSPLSEEIARQLENSGAKYVLTIGLFLPNIRQACEIYGGIEKIIVLGMEETPADCNSFIEMVLMDDGSLYGSNRNEQSCQINEVIFCTDLLETS